VITAGGQRQLIVLTPEAVTSLDPATGQTWWRHPMTTLYADATPVMEGDLLLVGGAMFQLDAEKPTAKLLWRKHFNDTSIPMLQNGRVYADKAGGHLACLEAVTGKQLWETDQITGLRSGACI